MALIKIAISIVALVIVKSAIAATAMFRIELPLITRPGGSFFVNLAGKKESSNIWRIMLFY